MSLSIFELSLTVCWNIHAADVGVIIEQLDTSELVLYVNVNSV